MYDTFQFIALGVLLAIVVGLCALNRAGRFLRSRRIERTQMRRSKLANFEIV
jgi:hypothetical protein